MLEKLAVIFTVLVALEHLYILYMEMFAWEIRGKAFFKSLPEHSFLENKGLTASKKIFFAQAMPAIIAIILSLMEW